jgi:pectin methylesterase-like acyl-CoA thioesterase
LCRSILVPVVSGLVLLAAGSATAAAPPGPQTSVQGPAWSTCTDTALQATFPAPPTVSTTGTITVTDETTGEVADSIDLSDPASYRRNVGGAVNADGSLHSFEYFPITVAGNAAQIHLHTELQPGHAYLATAAPGVFAGQDTALSWSFRTKPAQPRGPVITVAADGHGDFCTVQGAIDAVAFGNSRPVDIRVAPGTYTELVWVPTGKPNITVDGSGADRTVIQYTNNNTLNSVKAAGICPRQLIPGHDDANCWRASFNVEADNFTLRDVSLHNTTPHGGSQAEAFRGNADKIVLDRVRLLSYQDTLRLQGRGFVDNSYIAGDVDFTWGFGAVMIENTELHSLNAGYVTQVRNDADHPGYVFLHDRLTADPSVAAGSVYLGRIDPTVYPYSQAYFIDTAMGPQIAAAGWLLNNADCTAGAHLQFAEYGSTDLVGAPLSTAARLSCSSQLTPAQAATWSNPATLLSGWDPAG